MEKEKELKKCAQCSIDYKKYTFLRHGLINFDDLVACEKKLMYHPSPAKCKVYNYTTLRDTFIDAGESIDSENTIEYVIKQNRDAGVKYNVFYVENDFLNIDNRNQHIYGKENLIDCTDQPKLFSDAEFDYLLHITPEGIKGYVAVCFLSETELCGDCAYSRKCEYSKRRLAKETDALYRVLSIEESNHILRRLEALKKTKKESVV